MRAILESDLANIVTIRKFAILLKYKTAGQIVLKRLHSSNPQFVRCRRATMENVKQEYFKGQTRKKGMQVCNVYKIENGPLLQRFQALVKETAGGKIKGLFCGLPTECVEHMIVYGMHERPAEDPRMSKLWYSYPLETQNVALKHDMEECTRRLNDSKRVPVSMDDPSGTQLISC